MALTSSDVKWLRDVFLAIHERQETLRKAISEIAWATAVISELVNGLDISDERKQEAIDAAGEKIGRGVAEAKMKVKELSSVEAWHKYKGDR